MKIGTKKCSKCQEIKNLISFSSNSRTKDKKASWCKSCCNNRWKENKHKYRKKAREWDRKNKKYKRGAYLKRTYGINNEEYNELCKQQKYLCLICKEKKKLYVDHCHITGKIRGLLCNGCNSALGLLKEKIINFEEAIKYLTINN